jgi:predicted AlkP superfamily pyrophosphatase or phosphodiesterase
MSTFAPKLLSLLLVAFLVVGCGAPRATPAEAADTGARRVVVIVSMDGFRHDYASMVETPTLDRLAREGAMAGRLFPPFPTQTFVSHASIATGAPAEVHGIVNNVFIDRERGLYKHSDDSSWYDVPPLWIHAVRKGLRSFVYHWVASYGPWRGTSATKAVPFDKHTPDRVKLDEVTRWLKLPAAERPHLVMTYLAGCDHSGHHHGPDSEQVRSCIAAMDAELGRLVAGIEGSGVKVALLVVSDHGMTKTRGELNPLPLLKAAGIEADVAATGPVAHVFTRSGDRIAEAREILSGLEHSRSWLGGDLPADLHYRHPSRTGDIVLIAEPGYRFNTSITGATGPPSIVAHHGHRASHPDMPGIFYAWGDGIAAGAGFESINSVDVVPLACALLGIDPPAHVTGRAPAGVLAAGVRP